MRNMVMPVQYLPANLGAPQCLGPNTCILRYELKRRPAAGKASTQG